MAIKRIFSGIQPTGDLHLGNYYGAVQNWVGLQNGDSETIYCVVDYHAITGGIEPEQLPQRSLQLAGDLIACGIDPERSILFVQSHVPEHTELAWVFNAFAAYGDLSRMTQFKDKSGRTKHVNSGLFTYPVLQAADILLYLADGVPVGEDQAQHLELTRGIARRFNQIAGVEFFPETQILLTEGKRIMSLADPTRKMGKSYGEKHYVGIMEPPKRVAKKIKSAVTDAGGESRDALSPGVANLLGLLRLAGKDVEADDFEAQALSGDLMYGYLKVAVADATVELLEPIQARRAALSDDDIRAILADGAARARDIAGSVMAEVRSLIGVGAGRI
ncbi:MAG: tryptophan--tRNA ligase [Acidobacteria bacterium]|nr:tryptophan--tRNA ligase [Acidobacteriota bacterium]